MAEEGGPATRGAAGQGSTNAAVVLSPGEVALSERKAVSTVKGQGATDSWTTAAWLDSVGAVGAIAHMLLPRRSADNELQSVRSLAKLQPAELVERLRSENLVERFAQTLVPKLRELKAGATVAEMLAQHSKFLQEGGGMEYLYDDLSAFSSGLEALIGPAEVHVLMAMEREHTQASDSQEQFVTPDYGITTSPRIEWSFVAEPERDDLAWPVETRNALSQEHRRKPMSLRRLDLELAKMSARLRNLDEPALLRVEGIGGRLYTGPMCA
jgi:hypothetical protein